MIDEIESIPTDTAALPRGVSVILYRDGKFPDKGPPFTLAIIGSRQQPEGTTRTSFALPIEEPSMMKGYLKPGQTLATIIPAVKAHLEKSGFRVIALFQPGTAEGHYRDSSILSVSRRGKAVMMKDLLANLSYTT